ncbi:MAG: hypothetical protein ACXVNM_08015 [Bacteroidia bacterium]
MKKRLMVLSLLTGSIFTKAQVGMSCQYFPGAQVGVVTVKTENNPRLGGGTVKYKFGAGLPLLLVDRIKNHWYTLVDFSALYYGATQTNKANDDRIKISKAEGALYAGRLGYMFGEGEHFRVGPSLGFGVGTSNLDSLNRPFNQKSYLNYSLGIVAYKKFGKFRVAGKAGYELYRQKGYLNNGHGMYFEGTLGYSFYQKYGLSIMPCLFTKSFAYNSSGGTAADATTAKVKSIVLRVGLTRFF